MEKVKSERSKTTDGDGRGQSKGVGDGGERGTQGLE